MTRKILILLASMLAIMGIAVPSSGDFQTRKASVWSLDVVGNSLNGYNKLVCTLAKLHIEENINSGPYQAKADFSSCAPGAVADPSDTWNIYTINVVSDPNNSGSYIAYIWDTASITNGVTTTLANPGFTKYMVSGTDNYKIERCALTPSGSPCLRRILIQKNGSQLEVHANQLMTSPTLGQLGNYYHLSSNITNGAGYGSLKSSNISADSSSVSGKFEYDLDMDYSYSSSGTVLQINNFVMGDPAQNLSAVMPNGQSCIDRNLANAKITVFN